jgi:type VI secretion system protein ImpF
MKQPAFESTRPIAATSLLDRLQYVAQEKDIQSALLRDIFNLFNTKLPHHDFTGYEEAKNSIANYGLPNFAEYEANTALISTEIQQQIKELLERHEPRLKKITVTVSKLEKTNITFSISATLMNDPDPIQLVFDSTYQPTLQEFQLAEHKK